MNRAKILYLEPLKQGTAFPFAVYDIETKSRDDWTLEMIGFYDGENYKCFRDLAAFFDHVLDRRYSGYRIFAHFGGRFDVHFLFDYLRNRLPANCELSFYCSGSAVIAMRLREKKENGKTRYQWSFVDSFRLMPAGLKKLTYDFDVEHKKMELDCQSVEYNMNDCLGLYEVLERFFSEFGVYSETIASHAMRVFRTLFLHKSIPTSAGTEEFTRASYLGGRCEIYRYDEKHLFKYDVNSLYPSAMMYPVPVQYLESSRRIPDNDKVIGFYRARVDYPDTYLPALPVHIGKLYFPVGRFEGYFTSIELRQAIEDGAAVRIREGRLFQAEPILQDYVKALYSKKEQAEREGKNGLRYVCKLLLNSLYGKFGMRRDHEIYMFDDGSPGLLPLLDKHGAETGLAYRIDKSRSPSILPHIASAITSRARLSILQSLRLEQSWYTDTDSLFTARPLPTGPKLGELKCEGHGPFHAYYLKEYEFSGKWAMKGLPRKNEHTGKEYDDEEMARLARAYLNGAEITFRRMAGLKESIRDGSPVAVFRKVVRRSHRAPEEKRARAGDDTRPWIAHKELSA